MLLPKKEKHIASEPSRDETKAETFDENEVATVTAVLR